jgi:peptidoglycan/xylan/chitin deacetylase (PgdA/CDA1 family)
VDENVARAAESLGCEVVLWLVTVEHRDTKTPQAMAERVLQRVRPGAIILAHDGCPHQPINRDKTMAALPILVEALQKQGYRFVTVPQLLALAAERSSISESEHEEVREHPQTSSR